MAQKIQIKSCLKAELPLLDIGEFGLCTDTSELFIGSDTGNILLANNKDIGILSNLNTIDKTNLVNAINELQQSNKGTSIESSTINGNILAGGQELQVFDDKHLKNEINTKANLGHTHSIANITDIDTTTVSPQEGDFLKYQNGKWRPNVITTTPSSNNNSTSYLLELNRWNVKNDGTNAENTTTGINQALIWAAQQNYKEVVLPKGTYLIDENDSIRPRSFMTLNLNGSTLRVRANSLIKYAIIKFEENQQYSRVTNGRIEGDKDSHDYTTIPSTHEFGYGISVGYDTPLEGSYVRFITLDNLEVFNCTGDAITIASVNGTFKNIKGDEFESGGVNLDDGTLTNQANRIRYKLNINMNEPAIKKYGYFGLYGGSYGGLGSEIITDLYDVIFYKSDGSFLSSKSDINFFDEVEVLTEANYAKVVLHQEQIPSTNGATISIRVPQFPSNVSVEKCNLHHCRRLGVSLTGGKHIFINECNIHHIKGTNPQSGIDIEDARDLNQYVYIDRNNFYENNHHDIICVSGRHINITQNRLSSPLIIQPGADRSIVSNNFFKAGVTLRGDTIFSNNQLYHSYIVLTGSASMFVSDCLLVNSTITLSNTSPYSVNIKDCKILNDQDFFTSSVNPGAVISLNESPQIISNCSIEGFGIETLIYVPNGIQSGWIFDNVIFKDTRHPKNIITRLPPGAYTNCRFINTGRLTIGTGTINEPYHFNTCHFNWTNYDLFYVGPNLKVNLKISNCEFNGNSNSAFYFKGNWANINFSNNSFNFTPSHTNVNIISFYQATSEAILFSNNSFKSDKVIKLSLNGVNSKATIFRDNFLENVVPIFTNTDVKISNYINGTLE